MKKLIIIISLLCLNLVFSQEKQIKLYLLLSSKPRTPIMNDSIQIEEFEVNFYYKFYDGEMKLSLDKNGILKKGFRIKASISKTVFFKYNNINSINPPEKIKSINGINTIGEEQLKTLIDINNFMEIANKCEVYILQKINAKEFTAKRVTVERAGIM